jgi:hypothetical protein
VRVAGGADVGGGGMRNLGKAGVAGLTDLDRPVVDELGSDEADAGGD